MLGVVIVRRVRVESRVWLPTDTHGCCRVHQFLVRLREAATGITSFADRTNIRAVSVPSGGAILDARSNTDDKVASCLVSHHGSHLAVGVGSVRGEVFVALCVIGFLLSMWIYLPLLSFPIVAFEKSGHYVEAAAVTVVAVLVMVCIFILPDRHLVDLSNSGQQATRSIGQPLLRAPISGLAATSRAVWVYGVVAAVLSVVVGVIAGATWSRLLQYGILGAVVGVAVQLIAYQSIVEALMRPPGSPWRVTPGSAIHCRAPGRRLPRGRTWPYLQSRLRRRWRRMASGRVHSGQ